MLLLFEGQLVPASSLAVLHVELHSLSAMVSFRTMLSGRSGVFDGKYHVFDKTPVVFLTDLLS